MNRLVSIGKASKLLGVSITTLRRWEKSGKLTPERSPTGRRLYDVAKIRPEEVHEPSPERKTVAYARVSSKEQSKDLERQKEVLELYCSANGWTFEIVSDIGSGMNYGKKGLKKLLDDIVAGRVGRLVITHKDRLLRFGAELVFAVCEARGTEVVILNRGEPVSFEEDLVNDVLEIVTVFSARLYGARSGKNKRMLDGMKKCAGEAKNDGAERKRKQREREEEKN